MRHSRYGREVIALKILLIVGSVTYAMKGKNLLGKNGFRASVERIPHIGGGAGCGYGINVSEGASEAETLLQEAGIRGLRREERGNLP